MLNNKLVLQLNKVVGIISLLILLTLGGSSFAQVINFPLDEGVTAKLKLYNVQMLAEEKYYDLLAKEKQYFLTVHFGRTQFDVEVYNAKTGVLIRSDSPIFGEKYFFKKLITEKKVETYHMEKDGKDYNVSFNEVIPSLRIDQRTIYISIAVRDILTKKYLYMAYEMMYL